MVLWILGHLHLPDLAVAAERSGGPRSRTVPELSVVSPVSRIHESGAEPSSYADSDRVADQLPSRPVSLRLLRRLGPTTRETLKFLRVADLRHHDPPPDFRPRNPYRRRRRDAQRRYTFQCRRRVLCPSEAPAAFGPVEAKG